jgi:hypothetical protein
MQCINAIVVVSIVGWLKQHLFERVTVTRFLLTR